MTPREPGAVSDATPLIALAAVGCFHFLERIYGAVAIPPAVWEEVVAAGRGRPGEAETRSATWIRRIALRDPDRVRTLLATTPLDRGEAEAVGLALEIRPRYLLMDDRVGRSVARRLGAAPVVVGTLGVLAVASGMGLAEDLEALFSALDAFGFRHNEALKEDARRAARAMRGDR